jgi:hypothetical protein
MKTIKSGLASLWQCAQMKMEELLSNSKRPRAARTSQGNLGKHILLLHKTQTARLRTGLAPEAQLFP